jgi:hypothetical protein
MRVLGYSPISTTQRRHWPSAAKSGVVAEGGDVNALLANSQQQALILGGLHADAVDGEPHFPGHGAEDFISDFPDHEFYSTFTASNWQAS